MSSAHIICGGDEYTCKVPMCSKIPCFQNFWQNLEIIFMVIIVDRGEGGGGVHSHDVTILLIYCHQKRCCQHITTCIIAAIKWVNEMRDKIFMSIVYY